MLNTYLNLAASMAAVAVVYVTVVAPLMAKFAVATSTITSVL